MTKTYEDNAVCEYHCIVFIEVEFKGVVKVFKNPLSVEFPSLFMSDTAQWSFCREAIHFKVKRFFESGGLPMQINSAY